MVAKIKSLNELCSLPKAGKTILCCGCFDIVHPGHIRHLAYAKSKADTLIVSLTADRHISKGIYRPHVSERIRAESLAALEMVDYVLIEQNPTPLETILALKPDYFAKGFEYSDEHHDATTAEMQAVASYGGEMIFTPGDVVYSSTKLLNYHLPKLHVEKLFSVMKQFNITFGGLREAVSKFESCKIHVVGDTIVDTYTRTDIIGSNAKTPTFSVLYQGHEDYVGGAAIVAQHLKAAGAAVTFTTVVGADKFGTFVADNMDGIEFNPIIDATRPTTNKNVIIADNYRLLKIDQLDNTPISSKVVSSIANEINRSPSDCVIFSDFRHGVFNKNTLPSLVGAIPRNVFKVADSQVASRWGNITEFREFDLITPNEKEARFALADQDSNIGHLISETKKMANCKNILMKLGSRGLFFLEGDYPYSLDSFVDSVKDPVGAGDALLAYATLTMLVTKSMPMACIIGAIAAACECEIDGNVPIKPQDVLAKMSHYE